MKDLFLIAQILETGERVYSELLFSCEFNLRSQGSVDFFCSGPDSKFFRLHGPLKVFSCVCVLRILVGLAHFF